MWGGGRGGGESVEMALGTVGGGRGLGGGGWNEGVMSV